MLSVTVHFHITLIPILKHANAVEMDFPHISSLFISPIVGSSSSLNFRIICATISMSEFLFLVQFVHTVCLSFIFQMSQLFWRQKIWTGVRSWEGDQTQTPFHWPLSRLSPPMYQTRGKRSSVEQIAATVNHAHLSEDGY